MADSASSDDYYHCSNIGPSFPEYEDIHENANTPQYWRSVSPRCKVRERYTSLAARHKKYSKMN